MTNNKVNIIPSLGIAVNYVCNMQCIYCPPNYENIVKCRSLCEIKSILYLLDADRENGIDVVRLTGGEPLLTQERTRSILEHSVKLGFKKIILNTNGVYLRQAIPWMQRYSKKFECKVSLDTLDKNTFESITGLDALADVLDSLMAGKEKGLQITINILVTKINNHHVFDVLRFCEKNGFGAKIFDVFDFAGVFKERWKSCYYCIDDLIEDMKKKYQTVGEERLPGERGLIMPAFVLENGRKVLIVNHHGKKKSTRLFCDTCHTCKHYPCATGRFYIFMRADGMLLPCRLRSDLGKNIFDLKKQAVPKQLCAVLHEFKNCYYE